MVAFSVSLEGIGAGVDQSLDNPLGAGGMALHQRAFGTPTFQRMHGQGGGVATIRQYLQAGLVDELHLAYAPALLGRGEALLAGIDMVALGYRCVQHAASDLATHILLERPRSPTVKRG